MEKNNSTLNKITVGFLNFVVFQKEVDLFLNLNHCKHNPRIFTIKFSVATKCLAVVNLGHELQTGTNPAMRALVTPESPQANLCLA